MNDPDETLRVQKGTTFDTTQWSLVLRARDGSDASSEAALAGLCQRYWYPLYAFVRRSGKPPEEAKDLTQDFFCHLLEKGGLKNVDPSKGKFRSYLLASVRNLIRDDWKKQKAQKRGGDVQTFSLDDDEAEGRYQREPQDNATPEVLFEKQWAKELIRRTIETLKEECVTEGKPFEELKVYLVERKGAIPFSVMAEKLGVSESALRTSVHRLRKRYGEIFRNEVAQTVTSPDEIEEEVGYVLSALGS
jgi:RNA polymerase sigma-70 factor (ECF subfamily)